MILGLKQKKTKKNNGRGNKKFTYFVVLIKIYKYLAQNGTEHAVKRNFMTHEHAIAT